MVLAQRREGGARDAFEQIEAVMDLLPVGIMLVWGRDASEARVGRYNAACARLLGAEPATGTTPGELPYAYYRPDRRERLPEAEWPSIRAIATGDVVHEQALHLRRPDGDWRVLSASAAPLQRGGRLQGAVVVYQDVTAQHDLERALRSSEEWLNLTIEATGAGTLYAVPYGPATISPRFMEMFGIRDPAVIKDFDSFLALLHPDDRDRVRTEVEKSLDPAGSGTYEIQYRCVCPDGRVRWIANRGKVQFVGSGGARRAARVVVVTLDITDRKREEEALRASEARYARIAATIPGVLYEFARNPDGTGRFTYVSPRCFEIFEIAAPGLLGDMETHRRMIHPDDWSALERLSIEASRSGTPFSAEARLTTPSGRQKWIQLTSLPCPSAPGEPMMRSGVILDVTERKRTEEALREADRLKSQFLALLSHELRNPLAPIRNSLFLLKCAAPGSQQAQWATQVIERQTQHLTRLVDDLLDTTRISHGKIELERKPVDLGTIVRQTCDDHRLLFQQRGVRLLVEGPRQVWVQADETRMAQVIGNLLQNALKFTPRGGTAWVAVGAGGGEATVRVRDDGAGMEPAHVHQMFQPFAQADSSLAHPHGGLGLGLALAKGLMELHGGSVTGRSDGLGRGSEFTISLPLGAPSASGAAHPAPPPARQGGLVLLIEDNPDAAQTLAEVLEVSGYQVRMALDGRTGIASARELTPDVILCDIGLPDVDGYEVARTLRGDRALRSTRLIALTGYAQPEDRARAMEAGFDAHMAKPASIDELMDLIVGR